MPSLWAVSLTSCGKLEINFAAAESIWLCAWEDSFSAGFSWALAAVVPPRVKAPASANAVRRRVMLMATTMPYLPHPMPSLRMEFPATLSHCNQIASRIPASRLLSENSRSRGGLRNFPGLRSDNEQPLGLESFAELHPFHL